MLFFRAALMLLAVGFALNILSLKYVGTEILMVEDITKPLDYSLRYPKPVTMARQGERSQDRAKDKQSPVMEQIPRQKYPERWNFPVSAEDTPPGEFLAQKKILNGKQHACTCLQGEIEKLNSSAAYKRRNDLNFRWLHIPKTGTSLIITLWLYATSVNIKNIPQYIDTAVDAYFRLTCKHCYDFALMERYPLELFGHRMNIQRIFASLHTSHEPLGSLPVDSKNTTQQLAFFREPRARVVSAFDYQMHSYGIGNNEEYRSMKKRCAKNVTCYAARPGQLGCMLRMLTGNTCSVPSFSPATMGLSRQGKPEFQSLLQRAKAIIEKLAFIGLTEEWNESICRFHKQYGGTVHQEEFQNIRKGSKKTTVADLSPSYRDPADEAVYGYAVEEFRKRTSSLGKNCYEYIEQDQNKSCVSLTCKELGKQCGEWPDGCGGIRICGICSLKKRDGLPSTWRFQCSLEGECIRTCPPWETAGLWHRPRPSIQDKFQSKDQQWKANFNAIPSNVTVEIFSKSTKLHLFPADAVRVCVSACAANESNVASESFASQHCICGRNPTKFLKISPTEADYQDMYNLQPSQAVEKSKPILAKLQPEDTQPRCCPTLSTIPQKGSIATNRLWRKGIPLADFFQTYYLGCGGPIECEELGHENGASVVSYDKDHHFCFLGRNHRRRGTLDHETRHYLVLSSFSLD